MKNSTLLCATSLCIALIGCDSNDGVSDLSADRPSSARPSASTEVDVFNDQIAIARVAPNTPTNGTANILVNPDFEDGLQGWRGCARREVLQETDSHSGAGAARLKSAGCVQQSVSAVANQTYSLSCYIKHDDENPSSVMAMTAADSDFRRLSESSRAMSTSEDYERVDTTLVTPANTSFISVWIRSQSGSIIDNCSLTLQDSAVPPVRNAERNLLKNGDFSKLNRRGRAKNWSRGCGGSVAATGSSLVLSGGACADQGLSTGRVARLKNRTSTLSCLVTDVAGYADINIFLNEQLVGNQVISPNDKNRRVSLTIPAQAAQNGFVSLYADQTLEVEDCTYVATRNSGGNNTDADNTPSADPVDFASAILEREVRRVLGSAVSANDQITQADMLELINLNSVRGSGSSIDSLVGLEHAVNLESMTITSFNVQDISPLAGLSKLETLNLNSPNIVTVDALAGLTNLKDLNLRLSDSFSDLSPLEGLSKLETLEIDARSKSSVADLSPLSGLTNLKSLRVFRTSVSDPAPIASLRNLKALYFHESPVDNFQALAEGRGLASGDFLSLTTDEIDLSANSPNLVALHELNERGVTVQIFDNSNLVELPAVSEGL